MISRGIQGPALTDAFGDSPSVSADGRYIAFVSNAINFGVEPSVNQVWVRDRITGQLQLASRSADGAPANRACYDPAISPDGHFVGFRSSATNLTQGEQDGHLHTFLNELASGMTERMDPTVPGVPEGTYSEVLGMRSIAISANNQIVAFSSALENLVPGDSNGRTDVFVRDRRLGRTELVSLSSEGVQGNGNSGREYGLALSGDGLYVAFGSTAHNLGSGSASSEDVFVRDREAGSTELVSIGSFGGSVSGRSPSISADGRFVAFHEGFLSSVLVRDRIAGTTETASIAPPGTTLGSNTLAPAISADGRFVAFGADGFKTPAGKYGNIIDTEEVFVRDRLLAVTERVSTPDTGGPSSIGAHTPGTPSISADGRFRCVHVGRLEPGSQRHERAPRCLPSGSAGRHSDARGRDPSG